MTTPPTCSGQLCCGKNEERISNTVFRASFVIRLGFVPLLTCCGVCSAVAPQYMAHLRFENPLLEASIRAPNMDPKQLKDELLELPGKEVGGNFIPMGSDKQELRCVIGLIRHGDRTPKQKLKFKTTSPAIMAMWHACGNQALKVPKKPRKELKLKNVDELKAMLDVVQVVTDRYFFSIVATICDTHFLHSQIRLSPPSLHVCPGLDIAC